MPKKDPVVLSYNDSILYQSDVELLKGPEWLNDRIIGFVFEHLQHERYKNAANILFLSPEVTQFLKVCPSEDLPEFTKDLFVKKDFIFLPLNDNIDLDSPGGTHWSLLVFSKPESAFYHFDSYGDSNQRHAWELVSRLWPILGCKGESTTRTSNVLHQTNSHDCGIHVVCNAERVANHCASHKTVEGYTKATKEEITVKRGSLLKLIDTLKEQSSDQKKTESSAEQKKESLAEQKKESLAEQKNKSPKDQKTESPKVQKTESPKVQKTESPKEKKKESPRELKNDESKGQQKKGSK